MLTEKCETNFSELFNILKSLTLQTSISLLKSATEISLCKVLYFPLEIKEIRLKTLYYNAIVSDVCYLITQLADIRLTGNNIRLLWCFTFTLRSKMVDIFMTSLPISLIRWICLMVRYFLSWNRSWLNLDNIHLTHLYHNLLEKPGIELRRLKV